MRQDTTALPFLGGAVERMLQEYPDSVTGLSRTAAASMRLIGSGEFHPGRLFGEYQKTEEAMFMGDWSYWQVLQELLDSSEPLIALPAGASEFDPRDRDALLTLTEAGERVIRGELCWLDRHRPDRWIGGVHLTQKNTWCWDQEGRTISAVTV